ncbi:MAG: phosphotransferase family protein [Thermomicrobiales bacterium]
MSDSALDPAAILQALGVADGVTAIAPVGGGWDTALWRVERKGAAYALRVFRPEQAATCRREVAATRAAPPDVPVPAIHAVGSWRDRPALLLAWCPGQPLLAALRAAPWRARTLAYHFGQTQARLHAAPTPDLGELPDAWLAMAGLDDPPLQARLRAVQAPRAALLHLDYHPLNVMVAGTSVSGVLDWANARTGDPRADLARTATILRLAPLPPGTPPLLATLLLRTVERHWRRGYRAVAAPVGGMAPFYAWAGAVMLADLAPKLGRPGIWLEPRHLEPIRRWTARWRQHAGVPLLA